MRVEDALERYVTQLRADGRSEHTVKQYERHVRLLARWLDVEGREPEVEAIDHEVLALFLVSDAARLRVDGQLKKATATNALRSSVRTFFSFVHAAGYVPANPARLIRRARCGTPPPRALSDDERARLVAALDAADTEAGRRDAVLFKLMLACGLRVGSAVALDLEDVDLDGAVLHVGRSKGGAPYRALLPRDTVDLLRGHVNGRASGPIFPGRDGRRMTVRHAQRRFSAWAARAGIRRPGGTHALRHTRATEVYRRTGDVLVVKELLGHRSVASTLTYARVDERRLREAVRAVR